MANKRFGHKESLTSRIPNAAYFCGDFLESVRKVASRQRQPFVLPPKLNSEPWSSALGASRTLRYCMQREGTAASSPSAKNPAFWHYIQRTASSQTTKERPYGRRPYWFRQTRLFSRREQTSPSCSLQACPRRSDTAAYPGSPLNCSG
jgi:hypothetical protein